MRNILLRLAYVNIFTLACVLSRHWHQIVTFQDKQNHRNYTKSLYALLLLFIKIKTDFTDLMEVSF